MIRVPGPLSWSTISIPSQSYVCAYCDHPLASDRGWKGDLSGSTQDAYVAICHRCTCPTFIDTDKNQYPAPFFGDPVADVDDTDVLAMYEEARGAYSGGSFTAAVLCCRKLLMHIAVAKGAPVGKNFVTYVKYLSDNHFVPPDAQDWVDQIRQRGNEANHEIVLMGAEDAEELISFSGMLLKVIYQFPAQVKRRAPTATT
jgi:DNA-binding transcriptional LysR family regulator